MAKIDKRGVLHGPVSNMIYRSYRDQQIIQLKPARIKQSLSSQEAGLEFGLVSSTACSIRRAFGYVYAGYDGKMVNRLNVAVRKSIASSNKDRGERTIHDGDLSLLKGFQFNAASPLDKVMQQGPAVEIRDNNKISIRMPGIRMQDIKGPYCSEYIIRFVAISFDFRKEVYSYSGYREIRIDRKNPFAGGELMLDNAAISGRMVLLSMSVHGFEQDGFGEKQCINCKEWSPAEIIAGWHIAASESEPNRVTQNFGMAYSGNESLRKILALRATRLKLKNALWQPPAKAKPDEFKLPKGDILIN